MLFIGKEHFIDHTNRNSDEWLCGPQRYVSIGASHIGVWAKKGYAVTMAKLQEVMESEAVAELKRQSAISAAELRQYITSHMLEYPVLRPYANEQTVKVLLYALLSLPGLVLISLLPRCCGGSNKTKNTGAKMLAKSTPKGADREPKDASLQENTKASSAKKSRRSKVR